MSSVDIAEQPSGPDLAISVRLPPAASSWQFLQFAVRFWSGTERRTAWIWTAGALVLIVANLLVAIGLNTWNRTFFDALERRDGSTLLTSVGVFLTLIVAGAAFAVAMVKCRMTLQVRWREWVTGQLMRRWLGEQRYYRLAITDEGDINPEYRLAEDARLATEPVVEFIIGFINALLAALTFVGVLFVVGGSLSVPLFGVQWVVPGYIALAAVAYAIVMSGVTYLVGRPLVGLIGAKNEAEAQFRFEATRIRENAESIALIKGDDDERSRLTDTFSANIARWIDVIRQYSRLTWIINSNAFMAPLIPVFLAAPKYLAGELSLGAVMQIAAAFIAVLQALNWFVENFIRLAEWSASARRVNEFQLALARVGETGSGHHIEIAVSPDKSIHFDGLSIVHQDGRIVIADTDISIGPGERVLLGGDSGTGKSTLIRAIAGLWPWGRGRILLPPNARIAFVPQRPYLPLGSLRDGLAYPDDGDALTDEAALKALRGAGLAYLADRLDADERWDQILSGGERQRVAFARLLIHRPTIIVMDEATAALDIESEHRLLVRLFSELPEATIISVGHRQGLEEHHTRTMTLKRHRLGGQLTSSQQSSEKLGLLAKVA
jgi:vitamin B12/bleomycin/antimicrobial peptide transport system ATP-binding/permease protein